ncbi:MAG: hypothetical protein ABI376_02940 [Caulobacteraceae bacterium]
MSGWFGRRRPSTGPVDGDGPTGAYREGRLDERAAEQADPAAVAPTPITRDAARLDRDRLDASYDRGRRDARARRRGSPVLTLVLLVLVIVAAILIFLAIRNGSFAGGGAVVDREISNLAQTAQAPVRNAADKTGAALQNAGENLKQSAGTGKP